MLYEVIFREIDTTEEIVKVMDGRMASAIMLDWAYEILQINPIEKK